MLMLKPNVQLSKKEIKGIVNLTSKSVQGLSPENITVVDETGKILNDPDDDEENTVSYQTLTQIEMTRKVQERVQRDVQSLLDQALGEGRSYVRVNVELDFDQRQRDRQTYTPVVDDSGIIRSEQIVNESYSGTSNQPGGPAGTQSNIPGYVAVENQSNADYSKKEVTKNYEINEETEKTVASPGSIKRVNVAVLVNEDITQAQQESIQRSVASAVGIVEERGDTVSVEPLPFSTELADRRAAEEQAEKERQERNMYIAIALVLLIVCGIVAYYIRRKRERERLAAEAAEAARLAEEEERRREEEARAAAIASGEVAAEELTPEELAQQNERLAIEELIRNKPADMAMLIKTWLAED